MKCSFGISDFLEEIPSLSHSVVFLYFFALITEEGFLSSSCYSFELCIQMLVSFLFSFAFGHISSPPCWLMSLNQSVRWTCFQRAWHAEEGEQSTRKWRRLQPGDPAQSAGPCGLGDFWGSMSKRISTASASDQRVRASAEPCPWLHLLSLGRRSFLF